jgi:recombination protein RecA
MDIRRIETLKQGNEMIGSRTRVRVVKNKIAPPFRDAEFDIMYGEGISREGNILDVAADMDIVNKSGAWYSYGDIRLGQGRENAKDFLKQNPDLANEIETRAKAAVGLGPADPETDKSDVTKDGK